MKREIMTKSSAETMAIAQKIAGRGFSGMVICLDGELGAGKTTFTKGVAEALGIDEAITSPTFTIAKEYLDGKMPLYHIDAYRLDEDTDGASVEEYFTKDGIVVIEWPEMIEGILPEERLDVRMGAQGEETRILTLEPWGEKYERLCEAVSAELDGEEGEAA